MPIRGLATKSAAPLFTIASEIPNPAAIIITTGNSIESYTKGSSDSGLFYNTKKKTFYSLE